ncbi:MAG: TRAP transporter small permease [Syntrophales bacterium]|jgi:C4-dicarboxylate transporter DctQ subunit|nr:TRAP transporter small permease [Syntrophales bacterium]
MVVEKNRWSKFYEGFEEWTSGILLFVGLSLIMINVTMRYLWGMPESLLDEFSVYFVVWGTFTGMSVALRTNHHIKVDMFYDMMPVWLKRYISMFAHGLGVAFCIFYTYFGVLLVADYYQTGQGSTDSMFPLWIVNIIMPVSGVMFGARFVHKLLFLFKDGGKAWSDNLEKGALV